MIMEKCFIVFRILKEKNLNLKIKDSMYTGQYSMELVIVNYCSMLIMSSMQKVFLHSGQVACDPIQVFGLL